MKYKNIPLVIFLCIFWTCAAMAQNQAQKEINIAVVLPFSNEQSELGLAYFKGAQACVKDANDKQILNRKIVLKPIDNINQAGESIAVVKELIASKTPSEQIFAILGLNGDEVAEGTLPVTIAAKIPTLGVLAGSEIVANYSSVNGIFHTRVSDAEVIDVMIKQLGTMLKGTLTVIIDRNQSGQRKLKLIEAASKKYNIKIVNQIEIPLGEREFNKFRAQLNAKPADATVSFIGYEQTAGLFQVLQNNKYKGSLVVPSSVGVRQLINVLGKDLSKGIIVVYPQVIAADESLELVRSFKRLMTGDFNKYANDDSAIEGCIAAKVMLEGLRRLNGVYSKESFKQALIAKPVVINELVLDYTSKPFKNNLGATIGMVGNNGMIIK